jgi:hypothetical protein
VPCSCPHFYPLNPLGVEQLLFYFPFHIIIFKMSTISGLDIDLLTSLRFHQISQLGDDIFMLESPDGFFEAHAYDQYDTTLNKEKSSMYRIGKSIGTLIINGEKWYECPLFSGLPIYTIDGDAYTDETIKIEDYSITSKMLERSHDHHNSLVLIMNEIGDSVSRLVTKK